MTSISAVIQSIAETGLSQRCTYFKGTLEELNIDIERGNVSKDEWIFGHVPPEFITDNISGSGFISTKYPLRCYIVKYISNVTMDYRTADVQPTVDAALTLCRQFVHSLNDNEITDSEKPITDVKYPSVYAWLDIHYFGCSIDTEANILAGETGCQP